MEPTTALTTVPTPPHQEAHSLIELAHKVAGLGAALQDQQIVEEAREIALLAIRQVRPDTTVGKLHRVQ